MFNECLVNVMCEPNQPPLLIYCCTTKSLPVFVGLRSVLDDYTLALGKYFGQETPPPPPPSPPSHVYFLSQIGDLIEMNEETDSCLSLCWCKHVTNRFAVIC